MSYDIRIGAGDIPAYTLLTDDSYKVVNWTRQADMTPADYWLAVQLNPPLLQTFRPSLELGSGDYYGKFASQIEFTYLTEDMRQYIFNTIMGGKPVAKVTAYLEHPTNGFSVYTGQLVTPYAVGGVFDRFDVNTYTSNVYPFQRGTLRTISYLLQENGDYLLQENGDRIVLEQQS